MKFTNVYLSDFQSSYLAVCPKCSQCCSVITTDYIKITCIHCAYNRRYSFNEVLNIDLWLQIACCGEKLFFYNKEHLLFLKLYIESKTRERKQDENGWSNRSLVSRLPRWIKLSSNRSKLLKAIKRLEKKLEELS